MLRTFKAMVSPCLCICIRVALCPPTWTLTSFFTVTPIDIHRQDTHTSRLAESNKILIKLSSSSAIPFPHFRLNMRCAKSRGSIERVLSTRLSLTIQWGLIVIYCILQIGNALSDNSIFHVCLSERLFE